MSRTKGMREWLRKWQVYYNKRHIGDIVESNKFYNEICWLITKEEHKDDKEIQQRTP